MLKKRLIPILLLNNGRCVKGRQFTNFRDTGNPAMAARVYDSQCADELVFLDIQASAEGRGVLQNVIVNVAEQCFMPLTVGGGIKSVDEIRKLIQSGADKVSINTAAVQNPKLIVESARIFGSQAIVVSIDVSKKNGRNEVFIKRGQEETGLDPVAWANEVTKLGAGEILLTSIDREGTMMGYDLDLVKTVSDSVGIPVIANGGAGSLQHLVDVINIGHASAAAASSIFHFTDQSVIKARAFMKEAGVNVRELWL